jgi:Tol biopolymer transport system component
MVQGILGMTGSVVAMSLMLLSSTAVLAAPWQEAPALSLVPDQRLSFEVDEGTWIAPDLSPDGRTIFFDLLGDIYALDASGGAARPILRGLAFESQPVFSPDGRQFAFVSDRSGASNLWIANIDGTGLRQLSRDEGAAVYSSPAWSPDGRSVYVSRLIHADLAFEMYLYDLDGGSGIQLVKAKPKGDEGFDRRINALGAAPSPDGRYVYYAKKTGTLWFDRYLPHWSVVRRDLRSGAEQTVIASMTGSMRPALSRDGGRLAYASRDGARTELRIRDLDTGDDRPITILDHDSREGGYYVDLVPRFSFAADGKSMLLSREGGLSRLNLADGAVTQIPFTASIALDVAKSTRVAQKVDDGPVAVRVLQSPSPSPDFRSVAFTALGKLYTRELTDGAAARAVPGVEGMAFQPSWSPGGRTITYVTWTANDGGHVWTIPAGGGRPRRISETPAMYSHPVFSPAGRSIAVLRANHRDRLQTNSEISQDRETDILLLPAAGGRPQLVTSGLGIRSLQFDAPDRLRFLAPEGASSIGLDGADLHRDVLFKARNGNQYFAGIPVPAEDVRISPQNDRALVKAASQLYLVDIPPANAPEAPVVNLSTPGVAVTKLTRVGADYFAWSRDGRSVLWSVGSTMNRVTLDDMFGSAPGTAESRAARFPTPVSLPRDVPSGVVVLRGATVATMRGNEVIADADVVVSGNRIVAIGQTGAVTIPAGATIRDLSGKFIIPGLVDTHAHWFEIRRQLFDLNHWDFLANLAYGVTSGLEVQPFTIDVFGYQDMIDAGLMVGPRAFSTGPGVFVNSEINSRIDAVDVLTRYRDHYRTRNIKSYMVGSRRQRQFMTEAAAQLGMMPTTEGASDLTLNLTHAIDGFAGNEHNLPVTPLRDDIVQLYARTRIGYSPTFNVMYGGMPAIDDMIIRHDPSRDAKLRHFMPGSIVDARMRGREWSSPDDSSYPAFAADALRIQRAGGLIGIGSHGELQGLGYHYEMEAYASGGATPYEVLRAATIGSAEIIGYAGDIGSLEPGKLADLLILDADPLADIRNARAINLVMKNGRLYDAMSLDEVWPRARKLPPQWFQQPEAER